MVIDLTDENRPLLDALMRVVATSWPRRDEDAEETLVQAVLELVRLRAENAAMRPVVEAVANTHSRLHCALDCRVNDRWNTEFHAPDCLITQARAFITAHPTAHPSHPAGEAESEGE